MGRIEEKFAALKKINKKALITFVTAGDPDIETTIAMVEEMEKNGADLIELGIPYSDPIAEGPVIQAANVRALSHGLKIKDIMAAVSKMRARVRVPLLYLLYCNCILQYGPDNFFRDCAACGIDGVIIPDLPFEEKDELQEYADKHGVVIITLVSPISNERIHIIAKNAKGFLYCVSSLGVTGMRNDFQTDFDAFFSNINKASDIPKAIGFGISTTEHVAMLRDYCDGLIIGSAVVKQIERSNSPDDAVERVGNFVKELRTALDA